MKGCVVCNGEIRDYAWAKAQIADCDLLIAADGGARHLRKMNLTPQVIIGDMDSIDLATPDNDVEQLRFPEAKDKTDGELAVELALERGCDEVVLYGAAGGRLDHFMGNVSLLTKFPGRLVIRTREATLAVVDRQKEYVIHGKPGAIVSLIPFPITERVTTSGLAYALISQDLLPGTRGISNVLQADEACICVGGGLLLVYVEDEVRDHV